MMANVTVPLMYQCGWAETAHVTGKTLFLDVPVRVFPEEINV
jgi:hypothetical protein